MPGSKLQKRGYDFFVSYSHSDTERVTAIVAWLKKPCGLTIWLDAASGNAAVRSSVLIGGALANARGALFFVSSGWKESNYCASEFEVALVEQRAQDGFEIVVVRLDDADPPPCLKVADIIDLRSGGAHAYARLLCSLSSDVPHRFDNVQDVYLAAPWSRPTRYSRIALSALKEQGWRLVGDSTNYNDMKPSRIEAIMRTTRGVVAVLPHDPTQEPYATSRFIVEEAEIALRSSRPLLLLAEPGVRPPPAVVAGAFRGIAVSLTAETELSPDVRAAIDAFDDDLESRPHDDSGAYILFAGSLRKDAGDAEDLMRVIEHASNMRCMRGERLTGDNVQQAIVDRIRRAAVVIADVTDDHRNTLIESGVAMGSGTPLKLIVQASDGAIPKKRFMFEGQEVYPYHTAEERLGLCYWIARQFRRRVYVAR